MKEILQTNVVAPPERLKRILHHLKQLAFFGHNANPIMEAFGVEIDISSNDVHSFFIIVILVVFIPLVWLDSTHKDDCAENRVWTSHTKGS